MASICHCPNLSLMYSAVYGLPAPLMTLVTECSLPLPTSSPPHTRPASSSKMI